MKGTTLKRISIVLAVLMLIAFALSFTWVTDKVGLPESINKVARTAVIILVALFLVSTGVGALAVPILGVSLVIVGLGLLGYALYPYFKKKEDNSEVAPEK